MKALLTFTDGYSVTNTFYSSVPEAQKAMNHAYDHFNRNDPCDEWDDISDCTPYSAVLYDKGENVFLWQITKIPDPMDHKDLIVKVEGAKCSIGAEMVDHDDYKGMDVFFINGEGDRVSLAYVEFQNKKTGPAAEDPDSFGVYLYTNIWSEEYIDKITIDFEDI